MPGPSSKKLPSASFCRMDSRSFFWAWDRSRGNTGWTWGHTRTETSRWQQRDVKRISTHIQSCSGRSMIISTLSVTQKSCQSITQSPHYRRSWSDSAVELMIWRYKSMKTLHYIVNKVYVITYKQYIYIIYTIWLSRHKNENVFFSHYLLQCFSAGSEHRKWTSFTAEPRGLWVI